MTSVPGKPKRYEPSSEVVVSPGCEDFATGDRDIDHVLEKCMGLLRELPAWTTDQLVTQVSKEVE